MPVFISYNHQDREFVDKLAAKLVEHKAHVWVDRWEIKVGESLLTKVQEALEDASALLVVLSEKSVQSEWCKRELNAGLMRELEEKRVLVLPVRIDDCKIPPFLADKLYADFRTDFNSGFHALKDGIASVLQANLGRTTKSDGWYSDWSIEWAYDEPALRMVIVEPKVGDPCTILSQIEICGNGPAKAVMQSYAAKDLLWWWHRVTLNFLLTTMAQDHTRLHVLLNDEKPLSCKATLADPKSGIQYEINATAQRLGQDHGHNLNLNLGDQIAMVCRGSMERMRTPTPHEMRQIHEVIMTRFGQV